MTAHLMLVNGAKADYADALAGAGYRVTTVATMREALATRRRPDAVILELLVPDEHLPGIRRFTAPRAGRATRTMTVIALAEAAHEEAVVGAGAAFCPRPCPPDELVSLVRRTLEQRPKLKRGRRGPQGRSRRV
jgi:DNA-binding response OmpR family regulator